MYNFKFKVGNLVKDKATFETFSILARMVNVDNNMAYYIVSKGEFHNGEHRNAMAFEQFYELVK